MKTYCRRLDVDREFVAAAYDNWRKSPAGRKNEWRVQAEHGGRGPLIDEIAREIGGRSLSFEPLRSYETQESASRKKRRIYISSVKQQVCDYVVWLALEPMLQDKLGFYQVAGVKGKGQRLARSAIKRWSREPGYHVKVDVRKCYDHIRCELVEGLLGKYVASDDVLYVASAIMASYGETLVIGTCFSLLMANFVLSFAYHHVEGLSKVRRGSGKRLVSHQAWHLDDALLMSADKRDLKMAVRSLDRFLRGLGLSLKPWKVARNSGTEMLDLGGYRASSGVVTLRHGLFKRARSAFRRFGRKKSRRLAARACSYWGWIKAASARGFVSDNGITQLMRAAGSLISRCSKRKDQSCNTLAAQRS